VDWSPDGEKVVSGGKDSFEVMDELILWPSFFVFFLFDLLGYI
jgi:hypothetical protein